MWKVLLEMNDGRLVSSVVGLVEYIPGQWAEAPPGLADQGYHLTAYNSREAAELEVAQGPGMGWPLVIRECEVEGIVPLPPCGLPGVNRHMAGPRIFEPGPWPDGTVMARRVRVLP